MLLVEKRCASFLKIGKIGIVVVGYGKSKITDQVDSFSNVLKGALKVFDEMPNPNDHVRRVKSEFEEIGRLEV
ncbi:hypothetical protein L1887_30611 [Cichorium endivia]|nr:hypothetical protein L1887_30611 [Cichorium endivia]